MPLDVAPIVRSYETQRTLNPPGIPGLAPLPTGETDDTRRLCERFGMKWLLPVCTTATRSSMSSRRS